MRSYNLAVALQNDEQKSLLSSGKDFGYNAAAFSVGAATSVVTSVGNLGVYTGNLFGGDFEEFNTGEAMGSMYEAFGGNRERVEEFYNENSGAIELTGLVAGSLVPGGLAVNGFRALQVSGKVTSGVRAATGLKNPSMHSYKLNQLTQSIRRDRFSVHKDEIRNLYKQGFVQQAMEAGVYELATVAVLNRNPTLSSEDMGFMETFTHNWKDMALGVGLGSAIGGSLSLIGSRGEFKRAFKFADGIINKDAISSALTDTGIKGFYAGDTVAGKLDSWAQQRLKQFNLNDESIAGPVLQRTGRTTALKESTDNFRTDMISEINKTMKNRQGFQTDENLGEHFVDMTINRLNRILKEEGAEAFEVAAENAMENVARSTKFGNIDPRDIQNRYVTKYVNIFDDADEALMRNLEADLPAGKVGASDEVAFLEKSWLEAKTPEAAERAFIRGAALMDASELRVKMANYTQATARGENPKNPYVGSLLKEMKELQREFSPKFKFMETFTKDPINAVIDPVRFTRNEEWFKSLNDPETMFKNAFEFLESSRHHARAQELAPKLAKAFTKHNSLRRRFGETTAYLNPVTGAIEDTVSAPTLRDFGNVNTSRIAKGEISAGDVKVSLNQKGMDLAENTTPDSTQMSAHYFAATKNPNEYLQARGLTNKDELLDFDDIPAMVAKGKTGQKFRVERFDQSGNRFEIPMDTSTPEGLRHFQQEMRTIKKDNAIILRTNNKKTKVAKQKANDKKTTKALQERGSTDNLARQASKRAEAEEFTDALSEQEIARILDVDVDALTQDLLSNKPNVNSKNSLFFSETHDPMNPSRIKLSYTRNYQQDGLTEGTMNHAMRQKQYLTQTTEKMERLIENLSRGKPVALLENSVRAGDNFAYRMTSQEATATALFSSNPDIFSASAITQAIGKQTEQLQVLQAEYITKAIQVVNRDLKAAGTPAIAEASAFFQSAARNRKYVSAQGVNNDIGEWKEAIARQVNEGEVDPDTVRALFDGLDTIAESTAVSKSLANMIRKQDIDGVQRMLEGPEHELKNHALRFNSPAAAKFVTQYHKLQGEYSTMLNEVAQTTGLRNTFDPDVIYPGKLNIERYSHHAFIEDVAKETMWGAQKKGVIVANSADELAEKVAAAQQTFGNNIRVYTASKADAYRKAVGEYDAQSSFGDNFIDTTMANNNILWDAMPEVAENTIDDAVNALQAMGRETVREVSRGYYAQEIKSLMELHHTTTLADSAKSIAKRAHDKSSYKEQINQMLNISSRDKYEWYYSVQEKLDEVISSGYYGVRGLLTAGFSAKDEAARVKNFEAMSETMDRFGLPKVYDSVEKYLQTNSKAPTKVMQSLVAASQGMLSTLTLRMDHAQAAVNAMSTPILLDSAIKEAIQNFNVSGDALARIRQAASVTDPAGNVELSNMPFMMKAVNNFFRDRNLVKQYEDQGFVSSLLRDVRNAQGKVTLDDNLIDAMAKFKGGKWVGSAAEKLSSDKMNGIRGAFKLVSGITANDFSEQFVKFVATDVAFQMARAMKLPPREAKAMAWNFMTKVNGNYTASQRPVLFQGWMGQSLGLFQTYSFNMMQTAFRNIENRQFGSLKGMLKMQSGIFGVQSLPGFQAANNFISERTFGEKDFYSFADNIDTERDWSAPLVYGWASAATVPIFGEGIDFFNRGDLTPRTPIMLPTSIDDIPLVSFTSKFIGNIGETANKIANGTAPSEALMQGIARNGVNRPLAGLGQMAVGNRVTSQGSLLNNYDDLDWWTRIAKYMGTRTINEAITTNAFYRAQEAKNSRQQRLSEIGRAVKDDIRYHNGRLDNDKINNVLQRYGNSGGRMDTFNQWMGSLYQSATESEINKARNAFQQPTGRYLQNLTDPVPDYMNRPVQ